MSRLKTFYGKKGEKGMSLLVFLVFFISGSALGMFMQTASLEEEFTGAAAAAAFLESTRGNILLTTGSKELAAYSGIPDFTQRVYARVLPMDASLEACRAAGLKAAHIIAMQGPFSEEMDLATLRFADAAWMVTKDGGEAGGFPAKASAARMAGDPSKSYTNR